jgi:protein-L-isoaspartate(D-aspartate) O-methyltransferase
MRRIPRHLFVTQSRQDEAYGDFPLSIGHGQTISQPYMVAFMTQALSLRGGERVLEIGTGSGYQTALLAELSGHVYTIERIATLLSVAQKTLASLGYANISYAAADGCEGWSAHAPFDRILVAAAAPRIPPALRAQLADNGMLVIPVGSSQFAQTLMIARRSGDAFLQEESIGCRFVPLIGNGAFDG